MTGKIFVLRVMSLGEVRTVDAAVRAYVAFVAIAFEVSNGRSVHAISIVVARSMANPVTIKEDGAGTIGLG